MTSEKGARVIARLITEGKIPPRFIGYKSFVVLRQEIFSLVNRYNPKFMTTFEKVVYEKDLAGTIEGILKFHEKKQDKLFAMFVIRFEDDELLKKQLMQSSVTKMRDALQNTKKD